MQLSVQVKSIILKYIISILSIGFEIMLKLCLEFNLGEHILFLTYLNVQKIIYMWFLQLYISNRESK